MPGAVEVALGVAANVAVAERVFVPFAAFVVGAAALPAVFLRH